MKDKLAYVPENFRGKLVKHVLKPSIEEVASAGLYVAAGMRFVHEDILGGIVLGVTGYAIAKLNALSATFEADDLLRQATPGDIRRALLNGEIKLDPSLPWPHDSLEHFVDDLYKQVNDRRKTK